MSPLAENYLRNPEWQRRTQTRLKETDCQESLGWWCG
jgi:hypothetical protein